MKSQTNPPDPNCNFCHGNGIPTRGNFYHQACDKCYKDIPADEVILDSLDKISTELFRLKAIEQAARDFMYVNELYNVSFSDVATHQINVFIGKIGVEMCPEMKLAYENLKELL